MDDIPIVVYDVREVLNHTTPGLAGGTQTAWLEFALGDCDRHTGDMLFLTKITFLCYVSTVDECHA